MSKSPVEAFELFSEGFVASGDLYVFEGADRSPCLLNLVA